jgi:hypothetical protein
MGNEKSTDATVTLTDIFKRCDHHKIALETL